MANGKVELSFQGGTETIGGNIIILKVSNKFTYRYVFDFGVSADAYRPQMTLGTKPETIEEFVRRGLIPDFDMNFRACFLSHAHADHYLALQGLFNSAKRPDAIWATKTTSHILRRIQFVEKPLHSEPFEKGDYYEDAIAKTNGLNIRVALFAVDHDIPGACAFLIVAENNLIIYTGDFRDHGPLSEVLNSQFWDYSKKLQSDNKFSSVSVITEGTNFGLPYDFASQSDFDNRAKEILGQYSKELVAMLVDDDEFWDIFSVVRVIKGLGVARKVVLSKSIAAFFNRIKDSFLEDYRRAVIPTGLMAFHEMMELYKYVIYDPNKPSGLETLKKIAANPSDYMIFLRRNEAFDALDKIRIWSGHAGGCCILNFSANESGATSTINTFAEQICQMGFSVEKTRALARGHVSPHHLLKMLNFIGPDKVFIIHTLAPEGLKSFLTSHLRCEVVAPIKGKCYTIN